MTNLQMSTEQENSLLTLGHMLSYMRPHGSKAERRFIHKFISPLGVAVDGAGNLIKQIGDNPTVLWSCHTDTVHHNGGHQKLKVDAGGIVSLADKQPSTCLGADNTAGVWLLREMILAKKRGLYVFHRGEELGRIGSLFIAEKTPKLVKGIKFAVAFDRRDRKSIITHQMCSRCCSDTFAASLADSLGMGHALDSTGSFTDTASYTDLIGECTNVSAGFFNEHSKSEWLDAGYLWKLRGAILNLDVDGLKHSRFPGEMDPDDYRGFYGHSSARGGWPSWHDDFENERQPYYRSGNRESAGNPGNLDIYTFAKRYPDIVADYLDAHGVDPHELEAFARECSYF